MRAIYANPDKTDVLLLDDTGDGWALKPDDPRLLDMEVEPFPEPPREAVMRVWQEKLNQGLLLADGRSVALDQASRELISSSAAMAQLGGLPDDFAWRLMDNSYLPLNGERMIALALACGQWYYALFAARSAKLDAVARGQVVDVENGWPSPTPF